MDCPIFENSGAANICNIFVIVSNTAYIPIAKSDSPKYTANAVISELLAILLFAVSNIDDVRYFLYSFSYLHQSMQ